MTEYKLLKKLVINGKKRNIYKKKGSRKQYIKCKGKMMNLVKYKKMKTKKLPKKRKTKKKGGNYPTTEFYSTKYNDHQRAHMLFRGIEDFIEKQDELSNSQDRYKQIHAHNPYHTQNPYGWRYIVNHNIEALLIFDDELKKLVETYKQNSIDEKKSQRMGNIIGKLIKINLTHMPKNPALPNSASPVSDTELKRTTKYSSRPRVSYKATTYQGIPLKINEGNYEDFKECTGNRDVEVPFCKVGDRYFPKQKCDNVPNKCILDEHATDALRGFKKYNNAPSVTVYDKTTQAAAHNAARKLYAARNLYDGGKKKRVKRKKPLVKK